jgi:hypothetical protein
MCDVDAPSNAQAYAQALLTTFGFSNARTYARNLETTNYVFFETYVSDARGGAAHA